MSSRRSGHARGDREREIGALPRHERAEAERAWWSRRRVVERAGRQVDAGMDHAGPGEAARARVGGARDRAGRGDDDVRPGRRRAQQRSRGGRARQVVEQRERARRSREGRGGGEHGPFSGGDEQRGPVAAHEAAELGGQRAEVARGRAAAPAPPERPARERHVLQARRRGLVRERARRRGQHDGRIDRRDPVEQHPLGAAEHARRAHRQNRQVTGARGQRAELAPGSSRVAPQQRVAGRAGGERERLGGIVQGERPRAARGADDGAPAPREGVDGLAVPVGRVAAGVTDSELRMEHGRQARRAGAEAEVHVLAEQVHGRVERAEAAQCRGVGREAGAERPAHGAGALRAVGLDPLAQRAREQRRVDGGRGHRSHRARERVGGALHAPVGVEQARRVQRTRMRRGPRPRGGRGRRRAARSPGSGARIPRGPRPPRPRCWPRRTPGCPGGGSPPRPTRRRSPGRRRASRCRPRRAEAVAGAARRRSAAARRARWRSRAGRRRPCRARRRTVVD